MHSSKRRKERREKTKKKDKQIWKDKEKERN